MFIGFVKIFFLSRMFYLCEKKDEDKLKWISNGGRRK